MLAASKPLCVCLCVGAERASERAWVRVRVDKGGYAYDERGRRSAHASCFVKSDWCGARTTAGITVAVTRQCKCWKLPASQQTARKTTKEQHGQVLRKRVRATKTHGEIGTAFQKLNASVIRWQGKKPPRRQGSGMLREWTALNAAHPPTGLFSTQKP